MLRRKTEIVSLRLDKKLYQVLLSISEEYKVSLSDLIRQAIYFYFFEKGFIEDERFKQKLEELRQYFEMEEARELSKIYIRKATYIINAKKKLKKLIREGLTKEELKEVVRGMLKEAKAIGIETKEKLKQEIERIFEEEEIGIIIEKL